ncbi:relaxase/mobilization nuclease domain-containing protein [Sulfitobacter sp. S190]|uniref:relaxase/mobilization nuclease domain-containing protein n=1 Tax=Sulfitobacter sp. S190 TaxID=2867022 RepID=UPI0021A7FF74|nr:relaxase/mobilization nuclease domain-containing protein [Sulfitobacter sp. S190]UWR24643.1 relaxase/mobilization nuclease domain-containing protein [Sulfitobacter sp. S190]
MPRSDAVDAVTGEIFREGWSRIRGSMQGLNTAKYRQFIRASSGHRAAVFKAIRGGGTHTKSQLSNQLHYLTTKSTHIVDSSGFLDGKSKLESAEIKDLTERFAKRWSAGFKPKLGQTTHLLMSFPIGTRGTDVRDIATDVAERFLQTDDGHFDYIIAVHEDRDHPHAHLVLNRRSQEGEFFYLARDHRFNYDDFRLAMVEEAEKYGVRLEATRRVDRGVVHYPPRTGEVYAAKEEEREVIERDRVGADLIRTLAEIGNTKSIYQALAAEASSEKRADVADALFRAGEMLARGGQVAQEGDIYMAEENTFDELRSRYAEKIERVQTMIAARPDAERPALEKSLNEIQARVQHMQPLGIRSQTLTERPSEGGVYSEANIETARLDRLERPELRAQVDAALRGTGINAKTVMARLETGAQNAALERQWIADDLSKVAEENGLNLERRRDMEQAREVLNRVHVDLGTTLERAGVLREDGVIEEDRELDIHFDQRHVEETTRAIRAEMRAEGMSEAELSRQSLNIEDRVFDRIEEGQQAYLRDRPELLARPTDVIRQDQEGAPRIRDRVLAGRMTREIEAARQGAPADQPLAESVAKDLKARYPDMPDHVARGLGDTYAQVDEALRAEREPAPVETEELRRVIAHERDGNLSSPFADADQRVSYRAEVEQLLDDDQTKRLRAGDSDALKDVVEDRLDRLYAAKAYLQSDAATANSDAARAVVEEIAEREYEAQWLSETHVEREKGQTHG